MYSVGVDLHKEQSWFFVMNQSGQRISSKSIANNPEILKEHFKSIPKPFCKSSDLFVIIEKNKVDTASCVPKPDLGHFNT